MAENVVRAEAVMKKIDAEVERIKNVGITPRRQSSCLWIGCDPMPDLRNNRLTSAKGAYKQARFNCKGQGRTNGSAIRRRENGGTGMEVL
jgi:hypothetical protein